MTGSIIFNTIPACDGQKDRRIYVPVSCMLYIASYSACIWRPHWGTPVKCHKDLQCERTSLLRALIALCLVIKLFDTYHTDGQTISWTERHHTIP